MRKIRQPKNSEKGTALIMMIIFMLIASIIASTAVAVVVTNSAGASKLQQGTIDYQVTESGIEDALLRLLRNPNPMTYNLSVGGGTAVISITGTFPSFTILSTGNINGIQRKIQATTDYTGNVLTINSWREIN